MGLGKQWPTRPPQPLADGTAIKAVSDVPSDTSTRGDRRLDLADEPSESRACRSAPSSAPDVSPKPAMVQQLSPEPAIIWGQKKPL
eukprot:scaffold48_cov311-Pinguiococcus_pyrenoidosus.AAC.80